VQREEDVGALDVRDLGALVELGFLTNPEEEKLLADGDYRRKLSEALLAALKRYRDQVGARGTAR
jgi:hypothetical protein